MALYNKLPNQSNPLVHTLQNVQDHNTTLQLENSSLKRNLDQQSKELTKLMTQLTSVKSQLASLKQNNNRYATAIKRERDRYDELACREKEVMSIMNTLQTAVVELQTDNSKLTEKVEKLESTSAESDLQIRSFADQRQFLEKRNSVLLAKCEKLAAEKTDLEANSKKEICKLREELEDSNKCLVTREDDLFKCQTRVDALQNKLGQCDKNYLEASKKAALVVKLNGEVAALKVRSGNRLWTEHSARCNKLEAEADHLKHKLLNFSNLIPCKIQSADAVGDGPPTKKALQSGFDYSDVS